MDKDQSKEGPGEAKQSIGGDLVIPLMALAFTAYFFVSIYGLAWEARANGTVIGAILVILIGVQLTRTVIMVRAGDADLRPGGLIEPRGVLGKRIALIVILSAFVWFIGTTGTTLGLFLLMLASMLVMGVRDWRPLLLVAFSVAAVVYLLFILALQTKLPEGPVEHFLSTLLGGSA